MSATGRPLRFLGYVLGGWIVIRLGATALPLLWQMGPAEPAREIARMPPSLGAQPTPMPPRLPPARRVADIGLADRHAAASAVLDGRWQPPAQPTPLLPGDWSRAVAPPMHAAAVDEPRSEPAPAGTGPAPSLPPPSLARGSPWSVTGWLLWRRDAAASLAQAPLLGGSQGGLRVDYRLWSRGTRSLALYGRATRALDRPFAEEAAIGLAYRPVEGLPVSLLAERRQRLGDGGRNGFAVLAAGGFGPEPVGARLDLEGYAQAGFVGLPGADAFGDGRLALGYRLVGRAERPAVSLGVAISGGAQPGAARLDVGPELRLRLPIASGHLRLSAEWRERVAGTARPASGPAIALVADF